MGLRVALAIAVVAGCINDDTIVCGTLRCPFGTVCATGSTGSGATTYACTSPTTVVTGAERVRRALNNPSRQPRLDDQPVPFTTQSVVLDDGSTPRLTYNADGTFEFVRGSASQVYRFILPGTSPQVEYQTATKSLHIEDLEWGRANGKAPSPGTTLDYSVMNLPATLSGSAQAFVETTGVWTLTSLGAPSATSNIDWTAQPAALSGAVDLLDATQFDRAYYTIHDVVGAGSSSYTRIVDYRFDDVTMTDAASNPTGGALFQAQADTCVHVRAPIAGELSRLENTGGYTGTAHGLWAISAVPSVAMGPTIGFAEAYDEGTADTALDVAFGTPFQGFELVEQMTAELEQPVALGSAKPYCAASGTTTWITPIATSTCAALPPTIQGIPLPTMPLLAATSIASGAAPVSVTIDRTAAVPLTWTIAGKGRIDVYDAELFALTVDSKGATRTALRASLHSIDTASDGSPMVLIDQRLLQQRISYVLKMTHVVGYSGANNADFTAVTFPYQEGYTWSGVFTIAD